MAKQHAAGKTAGKKTSSYASTSRPSEREVTKPQVLPTPPTDIEKENVPYFLAWPSFLFEKMMNPWSNLTSAISWMDQWHVGRLTVPKSSSSETESAYYYIIELAGVPRDHINLGFQNGIITLRAQEAENKRGRGAEYHHPRLIYRTFTLPFHTDGSAITAELNNGMLTISIPKTDRPVSPQSRNIEVIEG